MSTTKKQRAFKIRAKDFEVRRRRARYARAEVSTRVGAIGSSIARKTSQRGNAGSVRARARTLVCGRTRVRLTSSHDNIRRHLADDRVLRQVGAHLTAVASGASYAFAGVRRARSLEADTTHPRGGGSGFRFRKRCTVVGRRVLAHETTDVRADSTRVVAGRIAARRVVSHFEDVRDVATRGMAVWTRERCGKSRTI